MVIFIYSVLISIGIQLFLMAIAIAQVNSQAPSH